MTHDIQQVCQASIPTSPPAGPTPATLGYRPNMLLTTEEAAAYIGLSARTLSTWRSTGRHGLRYIKVGSRVRYRVEDLDEWLASRCQEHTGQAMGK